jgi:hypothetical protein
VSGCRIGRVKLKAGGEVHRLPTIQRDDIQKKIVDQASIIAGIYEPGELRGFVVFGWGKDGHNSCGYFIDFQGFVGTRLLPSFVADAVRAKMIESGDWES